MESNQLQVEKKLDFSDQPTFTPPVEDMSNSLFQCIEDKEWEFKRNSIKKPSFSDTKLRTRCYMMMKNLAKEKRKEVIMNKRGIEITEDQPTKFETNHQPSIPTN